MSIFVFGGAGFIGRRVVRTLAAQGHEVFSLDINRDPQFEALGIPATQVRLDLTKFEDVIAAMLQHRPEVVINMSYMRETTPRPAMAVNILGMDNCFEAARLCGVRHVVYASSIGVNGRQKPYGERKISEEDPPHPTYQYAVHKVFNEWQAKDYREKHGMCITGIRIAHAAGTDKAIGAVDHIECIVGPARGKAVEFNYRDTMRCLVHVDEIAELFARVAMKQRPAHVMYNSGGQTTSMGELAEMVRAVIPDARIAFRQEAGGKEFCVAYMFDNDRAVQEFGIAYRPYADRVREMVESVRRGDILG
jgi:nucleoside-diphosphate-sugar epimerase